MILVYVVVLMAMTFSFRLSSIAGIVVLMFSYMYSYRQTVPVDFVVRELAFESTSKAFEFLKKFPITYNGDDQNQIDCKASHLTVGSI